MAVMRTSLSSGLLRITGSNIAHGNRDLRLFELGKVYGKAAATEKTAVAGFSEDSRICLLLSGRAQNPAWGGVPDRQCDIFDLKGEIEAFFAKISLDKFNFIPYTTSNPLSDDGADIEIYGVRRGYFGKVKRELLHKFDIEQDVFVAELNLDWFESSAIAARRYKPLPLFPSSYRDLALIVDEKVPAGDLLAEIASAGGPLLVRTDLFDVYRGGQTGAGKKSCAYALEFQSRERTLEQAEVDALVQTIVQRLGSKFGAALRS
jgi:phenylalanyl-tRNA synthetase beta chain